MPENLCFAKFGNKEARLSLGGVFLKVVMNVSVKIIKVKLLSFFWKNKIYLFFLIRSNLHSFGFKFNLLKMVGPDR